MTDAGDTAGAARAGHGRPGVRIVATALDLVDRAIGRRRGLGVLLVLGLASSALAALPALAFGDVVDATILRLHDGPQTGRGLDPIAIRLIVLLALVALADGVRILYGHRATRFTDGLVTQVRRLLLAGVLDADTAGPAGVRRGEAPYLVTADCQQLSALYSVPLTTVVADVLDSLMICAVLMTVSPSLLVLLLVPVAPIIALARRAGSVQHGLATAARAEETALGELADHLVANRVTVRVFAGQERERRGIDTALGRIAGLSRRSAASLAALMLTVGGIKLIATIATVAWAVHLSLAGRIPVGEVATVMMYLARFYAPAVNLSKAYQSVQRGAVSAQRILTELAPARPATPGDATIGPDGGALCALSLALCGVRLRVHGRPDVLVPDVRLDGPGLVLVTGASGSGKSTFVRAVLGLAADPAAGLSAGRVLIGGRDLAAFPSTRRLEHFAYAGQENALVRGTVLDNIAYPGTAAGPAHDAALRALTALRLDRLGERTTDLDGRGLSGGEARRVVLARALCHDRRPVLVADEVTSQLDAATRALVEGVLVAEARRRLVIVVAHLPGPALRAAAAVRLDIGPSAPTPPEDRE